MDYLPSASGAGVQETNSCMLGKNKTTIDAALDFLQCQVKDISRPG